MLKTVTAVFFPRTTPLQNLTCKSPTSFTANVTVRPCIACALATNSWCHIDAYFLIIVEKKLVQWSRRFIVVVFD
jgi:hypothetical protein